MPIGFYNQDEFKELCNDIRPDKAPRPDLDLMEMTVLRPYQFLEKEDGSEVNIDGSQK